MAKYHIRGDGTPGACTARTRACPLGGEGDHYDSPEAARTAYEKKMGGGGGTFATLTRGSGPEPEGNAGVPAKQGPGGWTNPPSTTSALPSRSFGRSKVTPQHDSWETYQENRESDGVSDGSVAAFAEVYGDSDSWAAAKASAPREEWVQRGSSPQRSIWDEDSHSTSSRESAPQRSIWDEDSHSTSGRGSDSLGSSFAKAAVGIGLVKYLNNR